MPQALRDGCARLASGGLRWDDDTLRLLDAGKGHYDTASASTAMMTGAASVGGSTAAARCLAQARCREGSVNRSTDGALHEGDEHLAEVEVRCLYRQGQQRGLRHAG